MKTIVFTVLCPILAFSQTGRISVRVTDFDTGVVITNARVSAGFNTAMGRGEGAGGGRPDSKKGLTDTNGLCTLTGTGNGGSVGFSVGMDGYYGTSGYKLLFTNVTGVISKKYQPWNPLLDIKLKAIGPRVPMYAKNVNNQGLPAKGKPVGYDLIAGDWVTPYGEGCVEDLFFTLVRQPEQTYTNWYASLPRPHRILNYELNVSFSNDGDGLIPVYIKPHQGGSVLRLPRRAPVDGYVSRIKKYVYQEKGKPQQSSFRDDANYFFRVRTEKDEDGNIVSALYGKMHGDFHCNYNGDEFWFNYYLNPNPNNRHVEFDPKQNLFKNLTSREEIRAP